jgi:peptide/nickel transport system substrate-binding protein
LHLDTVLRIFLRTGAKPLNYFQYGNPEVDRLMDEAVTQPTVDATNQTYITVTKIIEDEALWVPLCRRPENTITHKGIDGIEQNSYLPYIFNASAIKRA